MKPRQACKILIGENKKSLGSGLTEGLNIAIPRSAKRASFRTISEPHGLDMTFRNGTESV